MGFGVEEERFSPRDISRIKDSIRRANEDPWCHGILIQSPVDFDGLNFTEALHKLTQIIDPSKDVDGLHPLNLARLAQRRTGDGLGFIPCTPLGIKELLSHYNVHVEKKHVAMVGRSEIVGLPTALLFNQLDATVTLCHSKTANLPSIIESADVVVAAVGKPHYISGEWIKPGAVVIDVGINRMEDGKLVGDVNFEQTQKVASAITPVPGGVGPMTVAMLISNLFTAARKTISRQSNVI